MKNSFYTIIITVFFATYTYAQTQQAPSFILNQHLTGNQHYKASKHIEMDVAPSSTTGFEYNAQTSNGEFIAEIDPFMVFPPEEGEFGGPGVGDNGIVGTIGGALTVSQSGAANYSIPFKFPEGINGMKPLLSINYSSQSGNSFLGYGWNLSGLSSITRIGSNLFNDGKSRNICYDLFDHYALDGNRLFVVAQLSDQRTEYRTEVETYSKIISYNNSQNEPVTFEVYTKNGQIIQYGFTEDSKIELNNSPTKIRAWLINKINDRFGNCIDYEYFEDNENGEFGISGIRYGGNLLLGIPHPVELVINYDDRGNSNTILSYTAPGKKAILSKKITEIGVKVNDEVQYKYIFNYLEDSPLKLRSIFIEYNDNPELKTNPLSFEYKPAQFERRNELNGIEYRYYYDGQFFVYDPLRTVMTDFTGDGFADMLVIYTWESNLSKVAGFRLYKQNTGDNFTLIDQGALPNEDFGGFYPCDINGDMIADVILVKKSLNNGRRTDFIPWISTGSGFSEYPNFFVDQKLDKLQLLTADYNGDGKSEVAVIDKDHSNLHSMLYTFVFEFNNGYNVTKYDCMPFGNLTTEACFFETRDMTSDGIPEIIIMDDGGVNIFEYQFQNTGNACVALINHLDEPNSYNHKIYWGDFNADGYCDLLWQRKTTKQWMSAIYDGENLIPIDCPVTPLGSECLDQNSIRYSIKDYNGDGYADIAERYLHYEYDINTLQHDTSYYCYIYFSNGNSIGALELDVRLGYSPEIQYVDLFDMITDYNGDAINDLLFLFNNTANKHMTIYRDCIYANNTSMLISKFTDEYDNETVVNYEYLRNNGGLYMKYTDALYPFADVNVPFPIVSNVAAYEAGNANVPSMQRKREYFYEGAKTHLQGKGFLGFIKFTETDPDTKISKITVNDIFTTNNYITVLPVINSVIFDGETPHLLSETESQWTIFNNFEGSRFRIAPYLTKIHTREWDLNGEFIKSQRALSIYDDNGFMYGNPHIETAFTDETNINADTPLTSFRYSKTVTNYFSYDLLSDWVLGVIDSTVIKHEQRNELAKYDRIYNTIYPKGHVSFPLLKSTVSNPLDTLAVKTEFEYNSFGLITFKKITAPNYSRPLQARTETYHYKPEYGYRFLSGITNTAGYYSENIFNTTKGTLEKKIDVNGLETRYYYDKTGNLKETRYYDSTRSVSVNRWALGQEDAPADPGGPKALWYNWKCVSGKLPIITFFDHLGREIRVVSYNQEGKKIYADKYYDAFGRLWSVSDPYFPGSDPLISIILFDDLNRPIKITTPGDLVTNITYNGRTTSTSGPGPVKSIVTSDAAGRTVKSADADGNYVEYFYFSNGLLKSTSINSMQSTVITYNYDRNGNKIMVFDPTRGTNQWRYNPYNQLIFSKDENDNNIKYDYDVLGRLTSWQNPDKTDEYLTNVYHTTQGMIGLIDYVEQSGHKRQYFYNSANFYRISKTGETFDGQTSFTLFGYDELGRQNKLVYPTGIELLYRYNDAGYITKVINEQQGLVIWDKPKYNQRGQLTNSRKANIYETIKEYYPTSGLLQSTFCSEIQWFEYKYDSAANMTDRFNHLVKINGRSISENFSYDNHNQLTAVYKNGAYPRYYQYDGISNMQSKNDAGIFKYENPSPYQPSEMNLLPDAPLDLLQTHKVSYNSFNKVDTLISDEYRLEIAYGLGSQRIKQKLYSIENNRNQLIKEKKFISANTEIIIFEQKTDTITYITSPEGLTAIVVASSNTAGREWYWVFTDHLGSITTLVRNSDEQKVEMSYDAWGNRRDPATWENYNGTLPSFITDRGYTGHEHLDEFTLINMNGRMYDPQTARFLSPDVVVSDPSNPSSFNPYAYVLNNPLRYTDPSGYEPFTIAAAAIAAFILYGSHAKQNADPATGKWDWNITNWFGKDKPGLMLGITNTSFKHFFSNTTFFVSMDNTNGAGITLGYHTKYHFGGGSSPQNLYFPNDNTAAAEAAAVNSIARMDRSEYYQGTSNYMDFLIAQYQDPTTMAMELGLTACNGCGGNAGKTRNLQLAYFLRYSPIVYGYPSFISPTGIYPNPFRGAEAVFGDIGVMFTALEADWGYVFVLAGKDMGYFYSYSEMSKGFNSEFSIGLELGRFDVVGINPSEFRAADLNGQYSKGYLSVGIPFTFDAMSIGAGVSWSNVRDNYLIYGTSVSVSLGMSVLGPIGLGYQHWGNFKLK